MLYISYIATIIAALFNASSTVTQRLATNKPEARQLFSHRFFYEMIKNKLFIFGFCLQIAASILTVIALRFGPLIVVEPLLTIDLVFLLLLIHWRMKVWIQLRDWIALAAIIIGLVGLFLITNPRGGDLNYRPFPWLILISIMAPIVFILALVIRRVRSPKKRALLAGIAASAAYGLTASLTKLCIDLYTRHGFMYVIDRWPIYGLIVSGIVSIYLMVNMYGSGPLTISQPTVEVFDPGITVLIGIVIFGDSYNVSATSIFETVIFAIILAGGIIALGSSPRINKAENHGL